jgi:hypothetical protein
MRCLDGGARYRGGDEQGRRSRVIRQRDFPERSARPYALVIDRSAKLRFSSPTVSRDHVVVLLGPPAPDSRLSDLAAGGVLMGMPESKAVTEFG